MRKSRELNSTGAVILIVLTLLFSAADSQAQPKLSKGINLGRFLNGQVRWTTFWPDEQQIKAIKGRGFDHIRMLREPRRHVRPHQWMDESAGPEVTRTGEELRRR